MKYEIQYTTVYDTKEKVIIEAENPWEAERQFHYKIPDCREIDYIHDAKTGKSA